MEMRRVGCQLVEFRRWSEKRRAARVSNPALNVETVIVNIVGTTGTGVGQVGDHAAHQARFGSLQSLFHHAAQTGQFALPTRSDLMAAYCVGAKAACSIRDAL